MEVSASCATNVAGHLVQPHPDVGGDTRVAVERAVVVVVRPVVALVGRQADVVAAVHLAGRLGCRLCGLTLQCVWARLS